MPAPANTLTPPAAQRAALVPSLRLALSDIKIAHSVFALPFAILGACLASPAFDHPAPPGAWRTLAGQLLLVVACMVFARTWAMLVNRIADRRYDAANPRTANRAVASGRLPPRHARAVALACAALFMLCCAGFLLFFDNPWPVILGAPTLAWIAFYSFTKRFTPAAHLFLGGAALAFSPIAAAIAVHPSSLADNPALYALAGMVLFWVAGFDILYALQDIDFDRQTGLHSIPATRPRTPRWISRAMHLAAFLLLALAAWLEPRWGSAFAAACAGVGVLLLWEHLHFTRTGVQGLPLSFGLINGVVSCLLGAAGVATLAL